MSRSSSQSGNILILILIAIALLAALSWAFTQNSRTSSGALTSEQSRMAAQEIIAYGNTMADTVQKLKLRGCADTQFDFSTNSAWQLGDGSPNIPVNPNAPATGCSVFSAQDGKLQPIVFPESYTTGASPGPTLTRLGHGRIYEVAVPGIGGSSADIVLCIARLKMDICAKINDILGVSNPGGEPPTITHSAMVYDGNFTGSPAITDTSGGGITGKTAFCDKNSTALWQILVAR